MQESKLKIDVFCESAHLESMAADCAKALGVELNDSDPNAQHRIVFGQNGVELIAVSSKQPCVVRVDFHSGANDHRRKFGGGKGQPIAKAVGLKDAPFKPSVLDATAGLGGDAFVLASLGAKVTLYERSPVAYALLQDGLNRAKSYAVEHDPELNDILDNMSLQNLNSTQALLQSPDLFVDVIYLDPMFPERKKSAAVKKGMQAFQAIIGADEDEAELLEQALKKAIYRVVVKRPAKAPSIAGQAPSYQLAGKSCRFDVYALKSFKTNSK